MAENTTTDKKEKIVSLRNYLIKSFLLLTFLTLIIATSLGLYFNFKSEKSLVLSQQEVIARGAANTVKDFINQKSRFLEQASDINNLATESDQRDIIMNKLIGRDSSFKQLFLIDLKGNYLGKVSRLSTLNTDSLEKYKKRIISNVLVGKEYISPVYIDKDTGEPLILMAVPTKNIFKEYQGAFIAEMNLKFMWDLVDGIKVGDTGVAYVVDKNGDLIAFGDASRVLKRENLTSLTEVSKFIIGENSLSQNILLDVTKGIQNTNVISTYAPLDMPDWAVVVELPVIEAYQSVIQLFEFSVLIIIFSFAIAVVIGLYLSKRITKPIISLRDAASEITAGKFDTRINIESKDEIGQLAKSFNIMTEKLQGVYLGLEQKVKEKTWELVVKIEELEKAKKATANLLEDIEEEKANAENLVTIRTKELNEEKARLLASINSLSFGFIIADMDHHILLRNETITKLFGLQEDDEISINHISELLSNSLDIKRQVELCLEDKKVCVIKEIAFDSKLFRGIISPIFTRENNQIIGYVFLLEDMTEAYAVDRAKTEFVSLASHQLRTPLSAINWYTEMLLAGDAGAINEEQKKYLNEVAIGNKRMVDLVNALLNVSRLDLGTFIIEPELTDIVEMSRSVLNELKPQTIEKKLKVEELYGENIPKFLVDQKLLRIVFQNLLSNSVKYTPDNGFIKIELSSLVENQTFGDKKIKEGSIVLKVSDSGMGIPLNQKDKIFSKMFRADNARETETEGTGLGLYIVKSIVDHSGGEMWFESEENKGSTFYVVFGKEGMKKKDGSKKLD